MVLDWREHSRSIAAIQRMPIIAIIEACDTANCPLLHGALAAQGEELVGHVLSRQRRKARAGVTGENDGGEHQVFTRAKELGAIRSSLCVAHGAEKSIRANVTLSHCNNSSPIRQKL